MDKQRLADLLEQSRDFVVPYSEQYAEAHTDFAIKMWPTKTRRRSPEYTRWKFRGPSEGAVDGFLLILKDDLVTGQFGLIPARIRAGNQDYPCHWMCDLMVDSDYRRRGLGSILHAIAMSRDVVSLGSDPSSAAYKVEKRMGFGTIDSARKMILPIEITTLARWVAPEALHGILPALNSISKPIVRLRNRRLTRSPGPHAEACTWQEVAPLIAVREAALQIPHVIHDYDFLKWRCEGTPGFVPVMSAMRTGERSYALYEAAGYRMLVYDWHAETIEETLELFRSVVLVAVEQQVEMVMAYANNDTEQKWLDSLGFLTMRTPTRVVHYPTEILDQAGSRFRYCIYDSDGNL